MEFLSTGWLLAAPGFLGALVLLYFLKLKRREVQVGSTFLWKQALDDLRVNSPFQRLRMNLLLLLQLLALLLLLLALARPVSSLGGLRGTDAVLLVDVSASMQARDGGPGGMTRLERAKAEARRVIEDLSFGDRATVIAFADDVRALTDLTDSKATLLQALEGLVATDRPTRLAPAIERARTLVERGDRGERDPEVYVFSDGRVGSLEGAALDEDVPFLYVRVGEAEANVGIVGVDVHTAAGYEEETRVFASVINTGHAARTLGIDLYVDDELVGSRELALAPGGVVSAAFETPFLGETGESRRVRLALDTDPAEEALTADDVAHALVRPPAPSRVLLVTGGNVFLQSALSEDPQVRKTPAGGVPILAPEAFSPSDPALLDYDLIVLDRVTPEALPPGNYLCFGAAPPLPGLEDLGQIEWTEVLDWDETHPVARFVNFATLVLPTARRFKLRERDHVVVRSTLGPLVVDVREGDRRAIVCAFDLLALPIEGAWTFDPSFPIFLNNAVRALSASGRRDPRSLLVRTADQAELRFPPTAGAYEVTPPVGPTRTVKILPGDDLARVTGLDRAGLYGVTFLERETNARLGSATFAANLLDADESAITPVPELKVEGRTVKGTEEATETNRDMWKWAALAALAFVMLEWWVYNRRVFL